nr:reverse transcriptase domain-containing protein [Tanacetum cinerariifolium]GEZ11119.1 reverse transcriptase domain-containing protein [Tanacetum cinerariifolium]
MTFELANRVICTPAGIARDVFVPVGKFTFAADFVIVDYESDPRVPLILGRPFLRTARALIDVHGEEMILHDSDEILTLNMKHDTASYSNHPQRESANLINSFNVSKVTHEIHDSEGCNLLAEILLDIDAFNDIHPYFDDDPLSVSTTYSANSLLEEFTDELALITHPHDYDDNLQFDIKFDLKEIEFLLYQGKDSSLKDSSSQTDLANLDDYFVNPKPKMFTEEHAPNYSSPLKFDVYLDDFLENESYAANFYDDPFDSEREKIKESKLLMDELDLPCDSLPYSESDSFNSQDFSRVDNLPSTDNEDKEKKLAISYASLVFKDSEPPFCAPLFFKDVPKSRMLLPFSTKNKEKNQGYTLLERSFTSSASFWESSIQILSTNVLSFGTLNKWP